MLICYARLFPATLLICGAALALLLFLAHSAPLPDYGSSLTLCDVPCWAGIAPGRTRFEDTAGLLAARLPESDLHMLDNRIDFHTLSPDRAGMLTARQGYVDNIQVSAPQPLWVTILTLGAPRCIQFIDRQLVPELVNIFWVIDDVQVVSLVNLAHADPTLMIDMVRLWQPPPDSPCVTSDNTLPWPGFFALK